MYEFFGFFSLSETTTGDDEDPRRLKAVVDEVSSLLAEDVSSSSAMADVRWHNGEAFLVFSGLVNRRRFEAEAIERALAVIGSRLPGSYGLWYERDDAATETPGPDAYKVRVMTRGTMTTRLDPFLSPTLPTIEDGP